MNVEEVVRDGLRGATAGLEPPVDLLPRVRRRARRNRVRDSLAAAGIVAVVAAGGITVAVTHVGQARTLTGHLSTVDEQLLRGRTGGNLAGDTDYVQHAKNLMQDWLAGRTADNDINLKDQPEPHVAWAARTADGNAAVVAQQAYYTDTTGTHLIAILGFVGPSGNGRPRLVGDPTPNLQVGPLDGFFVKRTGHTAVVIQRPSTAYASFTQTRDADGIPRRSYRKVSFHDAIAVLTLPAATPGELSLRQTPGDGKHIGVLDNTPTTGDQVGTSTAGTLPWSGAAWAVGRPDAFWPKNGDALTARIQALDHAPLALDANDQDAFQGEEWHLYGTLPDGDHVVVTDIQGAKEGRARTVATVSTPHGSWHLVVGAAPDAKGPLPVRLKLDRGQGWVVAQRGATLSCRDSAGRWTAARHDATLCAVGTTVVRVRLHGTDRIVPLGK